jgi:hypothetical protein
MRLGIADHFGWAVAVTVSGHEVVDRRRIELVEPGVSPAPFHYESTRLSVAATASLVAEVRASVARAASAAFDEIAAELPGPVRSIAIRGWPPDFPADIEVLRRSPWEARADGVMYRQELGRLAQARGWEVCRYDARTILDEAALILGEGAAEVLQSPRSTLGPPWTRDHRVAMAAAIVG